MSESFAAGLTAASSETGIVIIYPIIIFALTPGSLNVDQNLYLDSKVGRNVYTKAIEPVNVPFDSNSKNINLLQSQLSRKAAIANWDICGGDILTITDAKG